MPLPTTRNLVLAALLFASPLAADEISEGEALAKGSDCMSCHQPTRKVVGPAYVDVAKKYKGNAGAVKALAKKVKAGGSGVWGSIPMTPHPSLSDADAEKMVKWVLAGAKSGPAPAAAAAPVAQAKKPEAPNNKEEAAAPKKKRKKHIVLPGGHGRGQEAIEYSTDEQVVDLLKKQDCFGCHQGVNRLGDKSELPWPSFSKIQERYRGGANVEALVRKVSAGGDKDLKWGKVPHPEYSGLPKPAVQALVQAVLSGKTAAAAPAAADLSKMGPEEWMRTRSDCFSCHAVNQKVVGPSYKDVAKKYAGAGAPQVAALVKKVKEGGAGVWGSVPMTAHATAPNEQVEKAVRWVLSQK